MLCPVKKNAEHILKGLFQKCGVRSALNIFKGFSVNFINQIARPLGHTVDNLFKFKGSFTQAVYFWKAKLEFVLKQHGFPRKPKV